MTTPTQTESRAVAAEHRLTPQQVAYFETFGFLRLPGAFADVADRLIEGFEDVFAQNDTWDTNVDLHFNQRRSIIAAFITKSPKLAALLDDPRVVGIVSSLLGPDYEYAESDGNIFSCDTSWHSDIYAAPMEQYHLKLSFYLDQLTGSGDGAIRLIPGTNWYQTQYAEGLRGDLIDPAAVERNFGVHPRDVPSWTLQSEPGDVIIWNFRTIHGSFGGGERRRLFSINFRQPAAD